MREAGTEGQTLSDSPHSKSLEESDPQRQEDVGPGRGEGLGSQCFRGTVSVWEDENVLEMMVGMVIPQCECA